jgi:type II secretory ATPase GspE/PulE/Tfp pilus assembly ATPase PilB-like protein
MGVLHIRVADEATIIAAVDELVRQACAAGASDIHLESTEHNLRIRLRLDGVLCEQEPFDAQVMPLVISRIKILAGLNIAEKRIPQDGKLSFVFKNRPVDVRVSTFPGLFGEKIVLRILDRERTKLLLDDLGMHESMQKAVQALLARPNGFFLVTGPTGSGKTTTLYSLLSWLQNPERNIVTLEDPVEYNLEGVTQGQIRPEAGFTFEKGIRAVLRQDPDILMVGEIRDRETARTAIEASLTGHSVLSSLHTGDTVGAVLRLCDMGVEPYLLGAALSGVLAQRLARTVCPACRVERVPTDADKVLLEHLGVADYQGLLSEGKGCDACEGRGMHGRTGIFELLVISDNLRAVLSERATYDDLLAAARKEGLVCLAEDALNKLRAGQVSLEELARTVS